MFSKADMEKHAGEVNQVYRRRTAAQFKKYMINDTDTNYLLVPVTPTRLALAPQRLERYAHKTCSLSYSHKVMHTLLLFTPHFDTKD